jgi:hypothetical protein
MALSETVNFTVICGEGRDVRHNVRNCVSEGTLNGIKMWYSAKNLN